MPCGMPCGAVLPCCRVARRVKRRVAPCCRVLRRVVPCGAVRRHLPCGRRRAALCAVQAAPCGAVCSGRNKRKYKQLNKRRRPRRVVTDTNNSIKGAGPAG
eukprot:gene11126-biopygen9012